MRTILSCCLGVALAVLMTADARSQAEPKDRTGSLEILTSTQGVDFGPYLADTLRTLRRNWYSSIPESAQQRKGKVVIEFAINKDGKVAGLKLADTSGDVTLDRAAWAAIVASNPLSPLPAEFNGDYLALRLRFFYNPDTADLPEMHASASTSTILHAKLITQDPDSRPPKYPKKARRQNTEGPVRLNVEIGSNGKVKDLKLMGGDPLLADASARAVKRWRFYPAEKDGRSFDEWATIRIDFRLQGEQVRAQVESYSSASQ